MNLYTIIYAIQTLKENMERASAASKDTKDDKGEQNYPYAFGRYTAHVEAMNRQVELLSKSVQELEGLRDVIAGLGIDADVIRRYNAMERRRRYLLEDEISQLFDSYDLLSDPKPEPEEEEESEEE